MMVGDRRSKKEVTTLKGQYSGRYKGGPVLRTQDNIIYLLDFPEDDKYEGKTMEVTGKIEEDNEHNIKPYKEGDLISQGWEGGRTVMKVISFKVIK